MPTVIRRVTQVMLRPYAQPSLDDLSGADPEITTDLNRMALRLAGAGAEEWLREWNGLRAHLPGAESTRYPMDWRAEPAQAGLLYVLTRCKRPRVAVETGVADGASSYAILSAMRANGLGQLVSFDVSHDVGSLVPTQMRSNWDLRILPRSGRRRTFVEAIRSLPSLDLFFHDSRHTYFWQWLEYCTAWPRLPPHGVLVSDDVDDSLAFLDYSRLVGVRPAVLVGARKVLGVLTKPDKRNDDPGAGTEG